MDRDSMQGYVAPASFVLDGKLELMNTAGKVVLIELADVKGVYFVREFEDVETSARKTFATRPRTEGLWVRLRFKDNDVMEGLMPNDLTKLTRDGFLVNPPDRRTGRAPPPSAPCSCRRCPPGADVYGVGRSLDQRRAIKNPWISPGAASNNSAN